MQLQESKKKNTAVLLYAYLILIVFICGGVEIKNTDTVCNGSN